MRNYFKRSFILIALLLFAEVVRAEDYTDNINYGIDVPVQEPRIWNGISFSAGLGMARANSVLSYEQSDCWAMPPDDPSYCGTKGDYVFGLWPNSYFELDPNLGVFELRDSFTLDELAADGTFSTLGLAADTHISDKVVVGTFLDYDFIELENRFKYSIGEIMIDRCQQDRCEIDAQLSIGNVLTIGGRLGLAYGNSLAYVLAGYSWSSGQFSREFLNPKDDFLDSVGSTDQHNFDLEGLTVGGGFETLLHENSHGKFTLKLEYRYTDFEPVSWSQYLGFFCDNGPNQDQC